MPWLARDVGFELISSGGGSAFNAGGLALILLVALLWFVVAASVAIKGETMDRPNRIAQLYGFTVCLVSIIVALMTTSSLLNAAIDRANPLQTEYSYGASLTSYEAYEATHQRERAMQPGPAAASPDTSSEATLRSRYAALVADRLAATVYRTSKTFVGSGIMLLFAVLLFVLHWRWLGRLNAVSYTPVSTD